MEWLKNILDMIRKWLGMASQYHEIIEEKVEDLSEVAEKAYDKVGQVLDVADEAVDEVEDVLENKEG